MKFLGKTVLITGSSRNIGKAIAYRFGKEGANIVLNARESGDELENTAQEFRSESINVLPCLADVSQKEQVDAMVEQASNTFGNIDILMINHSVRPSTPFLEITQEEWDWVLGINLHSTLYLCQAIIPGMIENGGGTVIAVGGNTGGTGGLSTARRSHAMAAGGGRTALLRALMREFAPYGIRFNFVSPGIIDTIRKHPEWYPGQSGGPQNQPERLKQIPLGRAGVSEDLVGAVIFLASQDASYVNGATIAVNGGWGM